MFFLISESTGSRVREQRGIVRKYLIEWKADNAVADPNIVSVGTDTAIEDSTPELAREAILKWMGLAAQTFDDVPMSTSFYGFPTSELNVEEKAGTEGQFYDADASWRASDSDANKPERQAPQGSLLGVMVEVSNQGPVVINQGVSIRAGSAGKSADFLELRHLFARESYVEEWSAARDLDFDAPETNLHYRQLIPFKPGHVDALSSGVDEVAVRPGTVDISPIPANLNISIEMSGASLKQSFLDNILRAADATATNSSAFTIQGLTFQPEELALVEATFSYNENNTQINLGFATGEQKPWSTATVSVPEDQVAPDFESFVHRGTDKYREIIDLDGADDVLTTTFIDTIGTLFPFDYVWTFSPSKTIKVEGIDTVVTDVDFVSVHKVFPSTDYATLFGTSSL